MQKESSKTTQKRHYRTNKQRALTSLQLVYSCVFTCFRFASTLNMLLCLSLCFVSLIQSSSVYPRIHFSPVCEFLVIVHTAKTGLLRCCLCSNPPSTTSFLVTFRCLSAHASFVFLRSTAWIGSNHTPSFNSSHACLAAHFFQ